MAEMSVLYERIQCVKCGGVRFVHIKSKNYLDLMCDDCYGKQKKVSFSINLGVVLLLVVFLWVAALFVIEYLL